MLRLLANLEESVHACPHAPAAHRLSSLRQSRGRAVTCVFWNPDIQGVQLRCKTCAMWCPQP